VVIIECIHILFVIDKINKKYNSRMNFNEKLKHNQQKPEPVDVLTFADVKLAFRVPSSSNLSLKSSGCSCAIA
jgi:hypothetical protein